MGASASWAEPPSTCMQLDFMVLESERLKGLKQGLSPPLSDGEVPGKV